MDEITDEIHIIHRGHYPPTLENMKSPPRKLYYRGVFPAPEGHKYLCVVGSRKWTTYGRDSINKIIGGLRGYPISIVSGLAIGIDSIAHMAALEAGLHCVAFPGSSLEWGKIYPVAHTRLARRIVDKGGALVSPWDASYETGTWAFPARNNIMAGLSEATLVVEAARGSGSLMTAKHAELNDRNLMAVPGSINAENSYGPHMLMRNGAAVITCANDLLYELGFDVPAQEKEAMAEKIRSLDELSKSIMEILVREETTIDGLMDKTSGRVGEINEKVSLLELEGLVKVENGLVKVI